MKKRLLSTLLALCMVLSLPQEIAYAEDTSTHIEIQKASSDTMPSSRDGVVPLSGYKQYESLLYDISYDDNGKIVVIVGCDFSATNVVIPDQIEGIPVTHIGSAFRSCNKLTSVTLPDSLKVISEEAFSYCSNLTDIIIPKNVTYISSRVFVGCTSLKNVTVDPQNQNYVSENGVLFDKVNHELLCYPAAKAGEYTIPDSITSIANFAFSDCSGLTGITIPSSVTSIGSFAFDQCSGLTGITIPDSITSMGDSVFSNCSRLTSITLPNNITSIPVHMFRNCGELTDIVIPDGVTSIESGAFFGCNNLKGINIPSGVTSIGSDAFWDCINLTSFTIPDGVTSIGYDAFFGCSGLTSLSIPDSVTFIDVHAFRYCTGLTSITLPNSLTSISAAIFTGCSGLTSVIIPDSVTSIGNAAFQICSNLKSITLPPNITIIEGDLFASCTSLTDVTIPNGVTSIEYQAFMNNQSMTSITIPASVTSITGSAFSQTPIEHIYFQSTKADWRQIEEKTSNISWTEAVIHCTDGIIPAKLAAPESLTCYHIEADTNILPVEWEVSGLSRNLFQINIYDAAKPSAPVKTVTETFLPADPQASPKAYSCKVPLEDLPSGTYTLTLQSLGRPEDAEGGEPFYMDSAVITSGEWTYTIPEKPVDPVDPVDPVEPEEPTLAEKLEEIIKDVNATAEEIRELLESIKGNLINAIKEIGPKIFELIKELEKRISGSAKVSVVDNTLGVNENDISITGAKLNFGYDKEVHLEIGQPESSSLRIPGQNTTKTFPFSMRLLVDGLIKEELDDPVLVTLPIPTQRLAPQTFTLWHFHGKEDPVPVKLFHTPYQEGGKWYVSFMLEGFSDFVMSYDEETPAPPAVTHTITFDTGGAPLTIPAMTTGADGRLSSLPMPSWNGYRFEGWFLADGSRVTTSTVFSGDTTVHARWERTASAPETNFVSIPPSEHGKIITADRFAAEGDRVNLSAHPDKGYALSSITVTAAGGKELTLREKSEGKFSFTMPDRQVKVIAEFEKIQNN